jgi:hypothetical protein
MPTNDMPLSRAFKRAYYLSPGNYRQSQAGYRSGEQKRDDRAVGIVS